MCKIDFNDFFRILMNFQLLLSDSSKVPQNPEPSIRKYGFKEYLKNPNDPLNSCPPRTLQAKEFRPVVISFDNCQTIL